MIRLLSARCNATGDLVLKKFSGESTPPYATLSHTWSTTEDEECSKTDVEAGIWRRKPGNRKIQFCMEQALQDGLEYVWIDTCCIDKDSSAELSEAINSMFKWYQSSTKCYVYLSDVSIAAGSNPHTQRHNTNHELKTSKIWKQDFQKSRWFTRGWTLQELLAPTAVEFFSQEGISLGHKQALLEEIHCITGIPEDALRCGGHSLAKFSVEKRLNWASNRRTKREEDEIYALLGIVDVSMAPIYGEGRMKARKRLLHEIRESQETVGASQETLHFQHWFDRPSLNASSERGHEVDGRCRSKFVDHTSNTARIDSFWPQQSKQMTEGARKDIHEPDSDRRYRFVNYGGTQNNNTGTGSQFFGNFTGPVNFT